MASTKRKTASKKTGAGRKKPTKAIVKSKFGVKSKSRKAKVAKPGKTVTKKQAEKALNIYMKAKALLEKTLKELNRRASTLSKAKKTLRKKPGTKGAKSKTMKGKKDYTTKKTSKFFDVGGHWSVLGPYGKREKAAFGGTHKGAPMKTRSGLKAYSTKKTSKDFDVKGKRQVTGPYGRRHATFGKGKKKKTLKQPVRKTKRLQATSGKSKAAKGHTKVELRQMASKIASAVVAKAAKAVNSKSTQKSATDKALTDARKRLKSIKGCSVAEKKAIARAVLAAVRKHVPVKVRVFKRTHKNAAKGKIIKSGHKGAPSKTRKGDKDYTTKSGDKDFHKKGKNVKPRKPYGKK